MIQLFCTQLSVIHCLLSRLMHAYQFLSMHSGWIWHCIFSQCHQVQYVIKAQSSGEILVPWAQIYMKLLGGRIQGLFHSTTVACCMWFTPWTQSTVLVCLFGAHRTQVECLGVKGDSPAFSLSKESRTEGQVPYAACVLF